MENNTSLVKQCPYCGEEVHENAQKCKHCNEWLVNNPPQHAENSSSPTGKLHSGETLLSCSLLILILLAPPIVLAVLAAFLVPDEEQHVQKIQKDVIACVEDQADEWLGFLGGTVLSPFVSFLMDSEFAQQNIKECFHNENTIRVTQSKLWSTGKIYNRLHPEGTTVSFGMFGIVFPFVDWDDIVLMTEENKNKLSQMLSLSSFSNSQSAESEEVLEETNMNEEKTTLTQINGWKSYSGNIKGIVCHFELYFEDLNDENKQPVHGTYYYQKQGADRKITLRGTYDLEEEILFLVEYFNDGRSNSTIMVQQSEDGFTGIFTKVGGVEMPITLTNIL